MGISLDFSFLNSIIDFLSSFGIDGSWLYFLLLLPAWGWGGTYYASKIGGTIYYKAAAWPTAADTSASTFKAILVAVGADNTLVIDGGTTGVTYPHTDLGNFSSVTIWAANQKIRGAISTDPDYSSHNGTVTLDGTGGDTVIDCNDQTGWEISYLTIINSPTNAAGISPTGSGSIHHCKFKGNWRHISGARTNGTTISIYDNEFQGEGTSANSSDLFFGVGTGTANIYYNKARPGDIAGGDTAYGYGPAIQIQGTGTYNIDNNDMMGTRNAAVISINGTNAGTVNIRNNIFSGCAAVAGSNGYVLSGSTGWTSDIAGNWIGVSGMTPVAPINGWTAYTESKANIYSYAPKYKLPSRRGYIAFSVDDYNAGNDSWGYISALAPIFASRGAKLTWYIDIGAAVGQTGYAANIASAKTQGVEIGLHTRSHSDLTVADATKIWGVTKAAETITIDRTAGTITLSGGGSVTGFKTKTLATIKTALEALGATVTPEAIYNTYAAGSINESAMGEILAARAATNDVTVLVSDHTEGLLKSEIIDALAALEAIPGIGAGTVKSFAYPFGRSNAAARSAVIQAGLTSARRVTMDADSSQHISNLDRYIIGCFNATDVKVNSTSGDATEDIKANINGLMGYLGETGSMAVVLSHSTSELTVAQYTTVLDEALKWAGVTVTKNVSEAITDIETFATDDGDGTLSYAWTDASDYQLKPGVLVNAGVDVGLTTDGRGDPIRGLPDIGAYEFQPMVGNFGFGFRFGF